MEWSIKTTADWAQYRDEIFNLYFDEDWALSKVREHMKRKHGLNASERQYKWLVSAKNSGRSKNIPVKIWDYIIPVVQMRQDEGKSSQVVWDGRVVDPKRVQRELTRYNPKLRKKQTNIRKSPSRVEIFTPVPTRCPTPTDLDFGVQMQALDVNSDEESLYVPEDAMSVNDYGSLEVITNELLLHGIPIFGRPNLIIPEQFFSEARTQSPIPRSPRQSWSWEALVCILSTASRSMEGQLAPVFPVDISELLFCSKSQLLNIALTVIINTSKGLRRTEKGKSCQEIIDWFLDDLQIPLLRLLFACCNETVIAFARTLIATLTDEFIVAYFPRFNSPKFPYAIKLALLAIIDSNKGFLSEADASSLLQNIATLDLPELKSYLISRGAKIKAGICSTLSYGLPQALKKCDWQSMAFLLDHVAVSDSQRKEALQRLTLPSSTFESSMRSTAFFHILSTRNLMEILLEEPEDENIPLTKAEYISFKSAKTARMITFYLRDPLCLEICTFLGNFPTKESPKVSFLAKEILLLGAVKFNNINLARFLIHTGTNPNCPCIQTRMRQSNTPDGQRDPGGDLEYSFSLTKRFNIWCQRGIQLPLDLAFLSRNYDMMYLLLDAQASMTLYILQTIYICLRYCRDSPMFGNDYQKDVEFWKALIQICLKLKHSPYSFQSLLYLAIITNDRNLILTLQISSRRPEFKSTWNRAMQSDPLTIALKHGSLEIIELVYNLSPSYIKLSYLLAERVNEFTQEKLEFLVQRGACVNAPCYFDDFRTYLTPLQSLLYFSKTSQSKRYYLKIVDVLLQNGADVNSSNSVEESPLQIASSNGDFNIMKYLIKHGADINITRGVRECQSPLSYACQRFFSDISRHGQGRKVRSYEIAKFLIQNGAGLNGGFSPNTQSTPLGVACELGSLELVRLLVEHGANIHLPSRVPPIWGGRFDGETPLQIVCDAGTISQDRIDIIDFLIENKADINANSGWRTALQHASHNGSFNLAFLLLKLGADPDITASNELTPLSLAARSGYFDIAKLLVNADTEKHITGNKFATAINCAKQNGHFHIVHYLEAVQHVGSISNIPLQLSLKDIGRGMDGDEFEPLGGHS